MVSGMSFSVRRTILVVTECKISLESAHALRLPTRMHPLLHPARMGLFERRRRAAHGEVSRPERGRISAALCLFHEVQASSAQAQTRAMPIPESRCMLCTSSQAHTVPDLPFLARVDRRQ